MIIYVNLCLAKVQILIFMGWFFLHVPFYMHLLVTMIASYQFVNTMHFTEVMVNPGPECRVPGSNIWASDFHRIMHSSALIKFNASCLIKNNCVL